MKRVIDRRKFRKAISIILAFLIFLSIFVFQFCLDMKIGYFSDKTLVNSINNSRYTEESYKELMGKMNELVTSHKLPKTVLKGVIKEEEYYVQRGNSIKRSLKSQFYSVDTYEIERRLGDNIKKYFEKNQVKVSTSVLMGVSDIMASAGKIYSDYSQFHFGVYLAKSSSRLSDTLNLIMGISALVSIIIMVVLMAIHRRKHRAIRCITYGIIAASFSNIIISIISFIKLKNTLETGQNAFNDFATCFLNESFIGAMVISLAGLLISAALMFIIHRIKYKVI